MIVILLLVLFVFSRLERAMRRDWYQTLVIETSGSGHELARIRGLLADYDIEIRDLEIKEGRQSDQVRLEFQVKLLADQPREEILSKLSALQSTIEAHWA